MIKKRYKHPNGQIEIMETTPDALAAAYDEAADELEHMASDMRQYTPCDEIERAARYIASDRLRAKSRQVMDRAS